MIRANTGDEVYKERDATTPYLILCQWIVVMKSIKLIKVESHGCPRVFLLKEELLHILH